MMDTNTTNAALTIFHEGKELENAATWKNTQLLGNHLATLIGAILVIAKAFGYQIPITDDQLPLIGGALAFFFGFANAILTVVTSSKIGFKPNLLTSETNSAE